MESQQFINTTSSDITSTINRQMGADQNEDFEEDGHSVLARILDLPTINHRERTDRSLTYRYAIKPWLQAKLGPLGIYLAIERSDTKKIVFRCRNKAEVGHQNAVDEKNLVTGGTGKATRSCPFKLRANYSKKNKKWNISIVNEKHNHALIPNKAFELIPPLGNESSSRSRPPQQQTPQPQSINYSQNDAFMYSIQEAAANQMELNRLLQYSDESQQGYMTESELKYKVSEVHRLANNVVINRILGDRNAFPIEAQYRIMSNLVDDIYKVLEKEKVV